MDKNFANLSAFDQRLNHKEGDCKVPDSKNRKQPY